MEEVGDEMFEGDILEDKNNNDVDSHDDDQERDRSSDEAGSVKEMHSKVYRCEKPDCKDYDRVFQFASQKVRHDG